MNVFDLALAMEKESQERFEKMAAGATRGDVGTLYSLLAASEQEHCRHLMALKETTDPRYANSEALERITDRMPGFLEMMTAAGTGGDDDGYRQVMKAEETAIRLFEKLAQQEPNENAAALLLRMADEERAHQEVMENIYDFVEAPRTYLEWGEFSNLRSL